MSRIERLFSDVISLVEFLEIPEANSGAHYTFEWTPADIYDAILDEARKVATREESFAYIKLTSSTEEFEFWVSNNFDGVYHDIQDIFLIKRIEPRKSLNSWPRLEWLLVRKQS